MGAFPSLQSGRWFRGCLHAHSTLSDGRLPLADVVAAYRRQGYDFLAVTDHCNARYGYPLADTTPFRDDRFTTLIGAELDAPGSAIDGTLYLNALGLPLDFAPPEPSESIGQLAERAAAAGAYVAIACPAWCGTQVADVLAIPAAHAIETWNETAANHNGRGDSWHLLDGAAAFGRRLHGLAVDDAHFTTGWPDWFGAWVMVWADELSPEALLASLKAGQFYSTRGPRIHDIQLEEDRIRVRCSPARTIIAAGRPPIGSQLHGVALTEATFSVEQFTASYCRITVIDHAGAQAWSNPIWFDGATG